jgi:hypothetical protein
MAAFEKEIGKGGDAGVNWPAVMNYLSGLHPRAPMAVLMLGSPLGQLKEAPQYSLTATAVPNDDQIAANLLATPWGTQELSDRLKGFSIFMVYPSPDIWNNYFQKEMDVLFLAKWVHAQSGALVHQSADLSAALKHLQETGLPSVVTNLALKPCGSLAFDPIVIPTWPLWMPTNLATATRMATNTAPAPLIPEMRGKVGIGALWDVDCDVDCWVWVKGQSDPVYYGNKTNRFARLGEDIQHATRGVAEWVELVGVTNIDDVSAFLNLYRGSGPVHGKVCFCWDGRTYLGDFTIPATAGNQHADVENRAKSPYWTSINLRQLIGNSRL